ncbi:J domain-containing protein [Bacillus sp. AK128]
MNSENYYEILGVSETATGAEIRKAYIKMIRQYTNETHPEEFQIINKAYKTLEEPEKRKQYDISIQGGGKYQENIDKVQEYFEREQYHVAMQQIENMLRDYPDDPTVLDLQAQCYYFQERYDDSERILKRLLLDHPQNELYVSQLASLYFSIEEYSRAISFYERLTKLNPTENNYYLRLSNCHYQLNNFNEACQVLENKLSSHGEAVYDFPLLSELYFLTIHKNDDRYHSRVVSRIESLAKSPEERKTLLNLMIDVAFEINTEHYLFKELTYLIKKINRNQDANVSDWVEEAEEKMNPNRIYYGDSEAPRQQSSYQPTNQNHSSTTNSSDPVRGSIGMSILLGIIASFFLTPIVGIIVGFIYYYKAEKIKEILSCLGCLIVVLFVLGLIFGGF